MEAVLLSLIYHKELMKIMHSLTSHGTPIPLCMYDMAIVSISTMERYLKASSSFLAVVVVAAAN